MTLKNRAKARSIGSSINKNLKLKKKEEKKGAKGPYIGSEHVLCQGQGSLITAVITACARAVTLEGPDRITEA